MFNAKKTITTIAFATLATTLTTGVMAERGGKGKMNRMCSPEADARMAEQNAELLGALNLNATQLGLFNQMTAQRQATKAQVCAKLEGAEMSRELRKEAREIMKDARQNGKETRKAFRESLTDEQRATMKEIRKNNKGKWGRKRRNNEGSGSSN